MKHARYISGEVLQGRRLRRAQAPDFGAFSRLIALDDRNVGLRPIRAIMNRPTGNSLVDQGVRYS